MTHTDAKQERLHELFAELRCLKQDEMPREYDDPVMQAGHTVMDWAAEHPEPRYPSWNRWFRETFPDSIYATSPCPNTFCRVCDPTAYHGEVECYECKGKPIPADIAEKLGIKPMGGKEE